MKKSDLAKIIREEISSLLNEQYKFNANMQWLKKLAQSEPPSTDVCNVELTFDPSKGFFVINADVQIKEDFDAASIYDAVNDALQKVTGLPDTVEKLDDIVSHSERHNPNSVIYTWKLPIDKIAMFGRQNEVLTIKETKMKASYLKQIIREEIENMFQEGENYGYRPDGSGKFIPEIEKFVDDFEKHLQKENPDLKLNFYLKFFIRDEFKKGITDFEQVEKDLRKDIAKRKTKHGANPDSAEDFNENKLPEHHGKEFPKEVLNMTVKELLDKFEEINPKLYKAIEMQIEKSMI